jgi:hypothetical protein
MLALMTVNQEVAARLKKAREQAGYASAKAAARAMGVGEPAYAHHENGTRGVTRDGSDLRYARFFRVNLEWLRTGRGPMSTRRTVPVLGYVGAGAEVIPIDDHAQGAGLDTVEASSSDEAVALVIRGDSQHPLQDGWLVLYSRDADGVPDAAVGRLCVVKVHEGPTLIKTVRRGRGAKLYNLESWNAPVRENVRLDWASPVLEIRPR